MYLIALDLSMASTGYAVFKVRSGEIVEYNSIPTKDNESHGVRLRKIVRKLHELRQKYVVTQVVAEDMFAATFTTKTGQQKQLFKTPQILAMVHGVMQWLFFDVSLHYFYPSSWKAKVHSGNATKIQVQQAIKQRYPDVIFKTNDESDAFALGIAWLIDNEIIAPWRENIAKTVKNKSSNKKKTTT